MIELLDKLIKYMYYAQLSGNKNDRYGGKK